MTETNSRKEHNLEVMVDSGGTNTAEIGKTRMLTPSRGVGFTVKNLARGKDVEASWHGFDRGSKPSYVPVLKSQPRIRRPARKSPGRSI
jgi:hypothetical protein